MLENDPPYCQGLQQAPEVMEPELQEGVWLVMMAAVWSGPDIEAIPMAVAVVQEFGGRVRLGVRPLDDHEETCKWCPDVPRFYATPLWLVFRQGKLVEQAGGGKGREQVREMIERGLSK